MKEVDVIHNLYFYYTKNDTKYEDSNIMKTFISEGLINHYVLKSVKYNLTNAYQSKIIFHLFAMDCFLNKRFDFVTSDTYAEIVKILGKEVNASIRIDKYIKNWHEADLTFDDFEKIIPFAEMSDNGQLSLSEINILTHKDYPQDKKNIMYGITGLDALLTQDAKDVFLF